MADQAPKGRAGKNGNQRNEKHIKKFNFQELNLKGISICKILPKLIKWKFHFFLPAALNLSYFTVTITDLKTLQRYS